jgi:multiple antibiotic resistance protein
MESLKPLIALLAIINPIGAVPFFIHFTQNLNRAQRRRTIQVSSFSAFMVIAVSALAGQRIIGFFGISIGSFQVGGGILLLLSALQMLNSQPPQSRPLEVSDGDAKLDAGASIAVVPLTIPLLTGPAAISTMIIYAQRARGWWEEAMLVAYGVAVGLAVYLAFSASGRISRLLGRTGIDIMTKLMGLILAALAVEIMADGLKELFVALRAAPR